MSIPNTLDDLLAYAIEQVGEFDPHCAPDYDMEWHAVAWALYQVTLGASYSDEPWTAVRIKVADELIEEFGDWSGPVRIKIEADDNEPTGWALIISTVEDPG